MRCRICDVRLKDNDLFRKDHRGKYVETCSDCSSSIYKTLREFDLPEIKNKK